METVRTMAWLRPQPRGDARRVELEVTTESGCRELRVAFPRHQPGLSALIGSYSSDGQSFVVKVAKTPEVRRWARAELGMSEPRAVQVLRRGTAKWNSLSPSPQVWPTFERFNDLCQTWLVSPLRETVEAALLTIPGAKGADVGELLDELRTRREHLRFAPRISEAARATFPSGGPKRTFALVQENVGSEEAPAISVRLPIARRRARSQLRLAEIEVLALFALAAFLAERSGLGLDLAPRVAGSQLYFPNVLGDARDGVPVYVDYFGLAQRDGNVAESGAFRVLYGRLGLVRVLCQTIYRDLTTRGRDRS